MPLSTNAGKTRMAKLLNTSIEELGESSRVLDIGCGKGIWGKLIIAPCYKVAVDAVDYEDKFELLTIYDEFKAGDMRNASTFEGLGKFDWAIMGDVLEHVSPEDARRALDFVETIADRLLVAVPYMYPQEVKNNPWENHRQPDLTNEVFLSRYPEFTLLATYNRDGKPFYGYYLWERC